MTAGLSALRSTTTLLLVVALTATGGWLSSQHFARARDRQLREELLTQARAIVRTMNPRRVADLTFGPADLLKPEHPRLCAQFRAYRPHIPKARWIYLMAERDGAIVFGPDNLTSADPDYSDPGEVYDEPPSALLEVFKDGEDRTAGPYTDRWGSFVSAFASVNSPLTGKSIAVLGLDITTERWMAEIRRARQIPLIFTAGLLALGLLLQFAASQARKRSGLARQPWRRLMVALCAALFLLLTVSAATLIHHQARQTRQATFEAIGRMQAQSLDQALRTARDQVNSAADFVQSSKHITRQEFRTFTASMLQQGLVVDMGWIPAVPAGQVAQVEQFALQEGHRDYRIWEPGPQNQPAPRTERATYYPILFSEPGGERTNMLGRDVGADSLQQAALLDALASGLTTSTEPLDIPNQAPQARIAIFQRVSAPLGSIVASMNLNFLFSRFLQQKSCDISLFQLDPDQKPPRLIAATHPDEALQHGVNEGLLQREQYRMALRHPVFVFGRCYLIVVHPTAEWIASQPLWAGWFVAFAGLVLTLVGSFFIAHLLHLPVRLEALVATRTQELQSNIARRTESERQLQRLNRLHVALGRLNEAVVRVKSREELFQTVCRIMTEVVQLRLAWIGWVEESTGRILVQTQQGDTTGYLEGIEVSINQEPAGQGFCGTCIRENRTCVCDDIRTDERTLPWREFARKAGLLGLAALPIREQGVARGVLTLYAGESNFFGEPERALMEEASANVSFALDHLAAGVNRRAAEARVAKLLPVHVGHPAGGPGVAGRIPQPAQGRRALLGAGLHLPAAQ